VSENTIIGLADTPYVRPSRPIMSEPRQKGRANTENGRNERTANTKNEYGILLTKRDARSGTALGLLLVLRLAAFGRVRYLYAVSSLTAPCSPVTFYSRKTGSLHVR
jgi:hypothetical protein